MEGIHYEDLVDAKGKPRAFKRFAIQFTVLVKTLPDEDLSSSRNSASKATAVVTNVSMSGLCIQSPVPFEEDTSLIVIITVALKTYELPVVVRHCDEVQKPGRTIYACGVQYVKSDVTTEFIPALAKYLNARGILSR